MRTPSGGEPSPHYTANMPSNSGPRLCLQPAAYVTYNSVPRCMSTDPCQYDLNQWSNFCLLSAPSSSNQSTMDGLPFHAATRRGVTSKG